MSIRLAAFAVLVTGIAACTPPPAERVEPVVPALGPDDYALQDVSRLGLSGAELLPEAAEAIAAALGSSDPSEGNYTETLRVLDGNGQGRVIFTQDGLADDSVRSIQHVVAFDLRPDAQVADRVFAVATGYGTRQRCYRAADPDAWTNAPCP